MLKFLIESISSPQNSTLTPIASFIDMSSIPPLRLNCPLPSIKSHLVYPKFTKFCFILSNEWISPTLNFNVFLYSSCFAGSFCIAASIVVTSI